MPNRIELTKIAEPIFTIVLADGAEKHFDPWEVASKLEGINTEMKSVAACDIIRAAFGFPTSSAIENAAVGVDGRKDSTLSMHQCQELAAAVFEYIEELDVVKKVKAQQRNSAASTASATPK